jgi:NAD(P)-dependent dehydrogenase (short-subunit alcohol dehydrogenase family)
LTAKGALDTVRRQNNGQEGAMSLFDLDGKVAVITGSSKGIGKAIAERLAEHGARVAISSRKLGPCEEVAAAINARHPGAAIAVAANISSKPELQGLVDATRQAFGRIDVLVCNAASNPYYGPMAGISDEQFRKVLDNNIIANHWLVQMVAPEMQARRDGAIIIVSSIGGFRGTPVIGAYSISKAADLQLARNLAQELSPHNIRINCIAPGLVKTDFARALWDSPEGERRALEETPLRRHGEPDDIAGAAVFLASRAGAWMTGQSIIIDGGVMS